MQNTLHVPLHKTYKNRKYFRVTCTIKLQILHYILLK